MKSKILTTWIILFVNLTGFTQTKEPFLIDHPTLIVYSRLGLNTFTEFNLNGDYYLKSDKRLSVSLIYNYGSKFLASGGGLLCNYQSKNDHFARKSIGFRVGIQKSKSRKSDRINLNTYQILYKHGWIDDMEIYDGCSSGAGDRKVIKYDARSNELGFMYYRDLIRKKSLLNFYFGFGISALRQEQDIFDYWIGTPPSRIPPPHREIIYRPIIKADVGFRLNLIWKKLGNGGKIID